MTETDNRTHTDTINYLDDRITALKDRIKVLEEEKKELQQQIIWFLIHHDWYSKELNK